jgi:hypothetical protein
MEIRVFLAYTNEKQHVYSMLVLIPPLAKLNILEKSKVHELTNGEGLLYNKINVNKHHQELLLFVFQFVVCTVK